MWNPGERFQEFIAFASDMHIAPEEAGAERAQSNQDRPARRAERLQRAIDEMRALQPAAVIFGGDNTNQPLNRPEYRNPLRPYLDQSPAPWFMIPGNHDVGSTVGWHHHDPAAMAEACRVYRKLFGSDWWAHDLAGFRLIGINSQIFGADLPDAREQSDWLRGELARPTDLLKAVFLHTPPYLQTPDDGFDDGSEQMCLRPAARKPLLDLLNEKSPDLLINAHCHRFWKRREPAWHWLGMPATALGQHEMDAVPSHNLPAGDDRVGWVSLRRDGGGWKAELHPLSPHGK